MTHAHRLIRCLVACLVPAAAVAAPETYTIDPVHSFPHFSVSHLGISTVSGRFDRISGKATIDRAARTGTLEVKIETASLNTGNARNEPGSPAAKAWGPRSRDEHLRSADFFNVAEYPDAVYKGTKFNFNGDTLESIDGSLTLLGVTKPMRLTVTSFKCIQHPFLKKDMCGTDAAGSFKRSEFGMKTFVGPVSDEVRLAVGIEAYKD